MSLKLSKFRINNNNNCKYYTVVDRCKSSPNSSPVLNMEETLDSAVKILSQWQSSSNDSGSLDDCPKPTLFERHGRDEVLEFIAAAKALHSAIQKLITSESSSSKKLASAQNLLRATMKRLSREFFSLLKANKDHLYPHAYSRSDSLSDDESTGSSTYGSTDGLSFLGENNVNGVGGGVGVGVGVEEVSSAMDDLKLIVDCMMSTGYGKKCLKIYRITRRSIVEDSILHLGARKIKKSRIQKMDGEKIQMKMNKWLKVARFAVKQIFLGEKILCDHLFSSSYALPPMQETCFAEVCNDSALILFKIPGKLAKHSKKSPDMAYRFLDLYDGISDLSLDIDLIFSSDLTAPVRSGVKVSINRIADGVRSILSEFESHVQKDASKVVVPGGGVYPLTRYVMDYLTSLMNHTGALGKILDESHGNLQSCLPENYFEDGTTASPIALWLAWQILLLLCKIDAKSELYKDGALSYLFLANNLQYVLSRVSGSKLESLLGETWVPKHKAKVMQYSVNYEKAGWDKIVSVFPKDQMANMPLDKVRECFKKFNAEFEDEYNKQIDWFVLDPTVRDEIKSSLTKQVMERYRFVYDKYVPLLKKHREKGVIQTVIKFTPEEVENYMSDLLDGPDTDDVVSLTGEEAGQPGVEATGVQRRRKRIRQLVRHLRV